jgi:FHA domain
MFVCPKGHQSQAGDYCDECGAAITAKRSNSSEGTAIPSSTPPTALSGVSGSGTPCPECDTPQAGRFCEVCGYDFVIAKLGGRTVPPAGAGPSPATAAGTGHAGASTSAAPTLTGAGSNPDIAADIAAASPNPDSAPGALSGAAGNAAPGSGPGSDNATGGGLDQHSATGTHADHAPMGAVADGSGGRRPAAGGTGWVLDGNGAGSSGSSAGGAPGGGTDSHERGVAVPDAGPLPRRTPPDAGASTSWVLVVDADIAFHARMQAQAEPDAEQIEFPAFVPPRRFVLTGTRALIGRQSRSRGIAPEIDLSGPPADSAVSHAHALLLAGPEGSWAVVDLESANGTYINNDPDPIPANAPCQLESGDRIHVGAWTTITLGHPS